VKTPILLSLLAFILSGNLSSGERVSQWDYAAKGRVSVSENSAGAAGKFRTFHCTTTDSPETVVLWYAKRFGFPEKQSLVVAARNRFSTLENSKIINGGFGHDTDSRHDHTIVMAALSEQHTHISFLHRPDFAGKRDVSISITSMPDGKTSIIVTQPMPKTAEASGITKP